MTLDPNELRISLRKLLAGLVLTIVPLSLAGLYITSRSEGLLREQAGAGQRTLAEGASRMAAAYLNGRVVDCRKIAADPDIVRAVGEANAAQKGSDSAVAARVAEVEKDWNGRDSAGAKAVLGSAAAQALRRYRQIDPRYLLLVVSDQRGLTVAASDKPGAYVQAKEPYWDAVYAGGRGAVEIRDAVYDEASGRSYAGVGAPVLDAGTGAFLGEVYALVDLSPLAAELGGAALVKRDGTVIAAPGVSLSMNLKSEAYASVRDTMGTLAGRQAGYVTAPGSRDGAQIVGFAELTPGADVVAPHWVTLSATTEAAAAAPLKAIQRFAMLMVLLGLLLLTLTAMYFFVHRREEFEETHVIPEAPKARGQTA